MKKSVLDDLLQDIKVKDFYDELGIDIEIEIEKHLKSFINSDASYTPERIKELPLISFLNEIWYKKIGPQFYQMSVLSVERQCEVLKQLYLAKKELRTNTLEITEKNIRVFFEIFKAIDDTPEGEKLNIYYRQNLEFNKYSDTFEIEINQYKNIDSIELFDFDSSECTKIIALVSEKLPHIRKVTIHIPINEATTEKLENINKLVKEKLRIVVAFEIPSADRFISLFCQNSNKNLNAHLENWSTTTNKNLYKNLEFQFDVTFKPYQLTEIEAIEDFIANFYGIYNSLIKTSLIFFIKIVPTAVKRKEGDISPILFFKDTNWNTIFPATIKNQKQLTFYDKPYDRIYTPPNIWSIVNVIASIYLNNEEDPDVYHKIRISNRDYHKDILLTASVFEKDNTHIHHNDFQVYKALQNFNKNDPQLLGRFLFDLGQSISESYQKWFDSLSIYEFTSGTRNASIKALNRYFSIRKQSYTNQLKQNLSDEILDYNYKLNDFFGNFKKNWTEIYTTDLKAFLDKKAKGNFNNFSEDFLKISTRLNTRIRENIIQEISKQRLSINFNNLQRSLKINTLCHPISVKQNRQGKVILYNLSIKIEYSSLDISNTVNQLFFFLEEKLQESTLTKQNVQVNNIDKNVASNLVNKKTSVSTDFEKRYVVNSNQFQKAIKERGLFKNAIYQPILQGYLSISSTEEIRLRRKDNKYWLSYKSMGSSVRDKSEIEIDENQFYTLWGACNGKIIYKDRYIVPLDRGNPLYENISFNIDIFKGQLHGLILAEINFKTEEDREEFSSKKGDFRWLGREETYTKAYKNYSLASNGLPGVNIVDKTKYDNWFVTSFEKKTSDIHKEIYQALNNHNIGEKRGPSSLKPYHSYRNEYKIGARIVKILMNVEMVIFDLYHRDLNNLIEFSIRLSSEKLLLSTYINNTDETMPPFFIEDFVKKLGEGYDNSDEHYHNSEYKYFGNSDLLDYQVAGGIQAFSTRIDQAISKERKKLAKESENKENTAYDKFRAFSDFTRKKMIIDDYGLSAIEATADEIWVITTTLEYDTGNGRGVNQEPSHEIAETVQKNIEDDGKQYRYFLPHESDLKKTGNNTDLLEFFKANKFDFERDIIHKFSKMAESQSLEKNDTELEKTKILKPILYELPKGLNYYFKEIIIYFRKKPEQNDKLIPDTPFFGFTYVEFDDNGEQLPELLRLDKNVLTVIVQYLKSFMLSNFSLEKKGQKIELYWDIEIPCKGDYFQIRRGHAVNSLDPIGKIHSVGLNLHFIDENPPKIGNVYYQLVRVFSNYKYVYPQLLKIKI